jgi:hypothetical protein
MVRRCLGCHHSHTYIPLSLPSIIVVAALDVLAWLDSYSLAIEVTCEVVDASLAGAGLVLGGDPVVLQPGAHPRFPFDGLRPSCRQLT